MSRRRLLAAVVWLAALLAVPATAAAAAFLPPAGGVWHGVASGRDVADFTARTGRRPAVWQHWITWGDTFRYALERSDAARARVMLHLSTAPAQGAAGRISPGAIARGEGDAYLVGLGATLAEHGRPVYLRLMAEMNNCDLAYASHDCAGRPRGADHRAGAYTQAWRRAVLVLRGGPVARIDARLRALGLPPLRTGASALPTPPVAVVWSPMTGGSPMIRALRPGAFWPGAAYVDWVSTSFYSRFPNFHLLEPFYRDFAERHRKPFAFGEWAMWGGDDAAFARRLLAWVRDHRRVRMLVYNQGHDPAGPFRLRRFPAAARVLRGGLGAERYAPVPAEFTGG
jgi:hypothetical protein